MKLFNLTILSLLFSIGTYGQYKNHLYPIKEDNKWGYINQSGKTIIKPQFYIANKFSEDLAAVRLNGTYGYIDITGNFVIRPQFDLASAFVNGLAEVYLNGKPFIIDVKGNIIFQHEHKDILPFHNHTFAIAETSTGKFSVINKSGELIIDTLFKDIFFSEGVFVVTGINHLPYSSDTTKKPCYEVGLVDTMGNWLIKYGRYSEISNFQDGLAEAELIQATESGSGWSNHKAIIDVSGRERFIVPAHQFYLDYDREGYFDGIAEVNIYSVDIDTVSVWGGGRKYSYKGVIDGNGKIIFGDTSWRTLTPYSFNRAFVADGSGGWKMIDKKGHRVGNLTFLNVLTESYNNYESLFRDGKAYVELNTGICAIDTNGKILIDPVNFDDLDYDYAYRKENVIWFEEDVSSEDSKCPYRYGFWIPATQTIIKPEYVDFDKSSFADSLIYVMSEDGRMGYLNLNGKEIWKAPKEKNIQLYLNIDFMNRGYFYAASKYKEDLSGFGGWGTSDNLSAENFSNLRKKNDSLQIVIDTTAKTTWMKSYKGIKLLVGNGSKDTLYFDAQDSRLYLKLQAQDKKGEWKDIEYLPSSWCGNSYHTLFLSPDEYWDFPIPVYQGEFKTKIRAQLLYKRSIEQMEDNTIYSNVIDGYINPGQFWNKRDYYPKGLMDPYND